jgi:hypothetical protein
VKGTTVVGAVVLTGLLTVGGGRGIIDSVWPIDDEGRWVVDRIHKEFGGRGDPITSYTLECSLPGEEHTDVMISVEPAVGEPLLEQWEQVEDGTRTEPVACPYAVDAR